MLRAIISAVRNRFHQAQIASLANRLGPHIARDIGIADLGSYANSPVLRPVSPTKFEQGSRDGHNSENTCPSAKAVSAERCQPAGLVFRAAGTGV